MPTNTDNISCLLFGHNFYKKSTSISDADKVICKNCNHTATIDSHGNFNANGTNDKTFENTLRKLFLLRRKMATNL